MKVTVGLLAFFPASGLPTVQGVSCNYSGKLFNLILARIEERQPEEKCERAGE